MVEPVTLSLAVIALVGTIATGIIQLFRGANFENIKSDCCSSTMDIHENDNVRINR